MHVYAVAHVPVAPGAPEALTTYVSPGAQSPEQVRAAVAHYSQAPIQGIRGFELRYPPVPDDPRQGLEQVARLYDSCERCHLSDRRTRIVHWRGNPEAVVAALGEGPGRKEDSVGKPFVGPSGNLESEGLRDYGLDPNLDLAWLNLVGCRPCDNRWADDRKPTLVEKLACSERTYMLLQALRPRCVICLGQEATALFWDEPPANKGRFWTKVVPRDHPEDWVLVGVCRHPAYLLRAAMANYKEFFKGELFLRELRAWLPHLKQAGKVSAWRFGLRYLRDVRPTVGG